MRNVVLNYISSILLAVVTHLGKLIQCSTRQQC